MNTVFRIVWSVSRGQSVVTSELAKGRTKSRDGAVRRSLLAIGVPVAIGAAMMGSDDAQARKFASDGLLCNSGGTGSTVGRLAAAGTNNDPIDGSGTFSTVAGCEADGNNQLAATAYGTYSEVTGAGGNALGFNAEAAQWSTALGLETRATSTGSTALGFGSQATANNAVAIGGAGGDGTTPLAVADSTIASGQHSIAIGANNVRGAQASAMNAIAIGGEASADSSASVAIGQGASVTTGAGGGVALGSLAEASTSTSTALGAGAQALATNTISIGANRGTPSVASADGAQAIGNIAQASGEASMAYGRQSNALGSGAIAMGQSAQANADGSVAIGGSTEGFDGTGAAQADGPLSIAVGNQSLAAGDRAIAMGLRAETLNQYGIALGADSSVSGDYGLALGVVAQASGEYAGAVGYNSNAGGARASAYGYGASASEADSVALGDSTASGIGALAGGVGASATADSAIALGDGATATGVQSISIGTGNQVSGDGSGAVGDPTTITGAGSYSLGNNNAIDADEAGVFGNRNVLAGTATGSRIIGNDNDLDVADAFVMGNGADVTVADGVALGSGSLADGDALGDAAFQPLDAAGNPIAVTAPTATSEVSVGDVGSERRVTNVAAGSADTDAVNVSQLATVDQKADVASQGWDLTAEGTDSTNVAPGDAVDLSNTDGNLVIAKNAADGAQEDVTFDLADDVTIGNSLTVNNGPTLNDNGIDMGGDTITNVGAPVNGGDAVNLDYFNENRAHYYSVNDGGTQGGNYANDGAAGVNSLAAGVDSSATADGGIAVGYGATTGDVDSVALGTDSVTAAPVGTASTTIGGTTYTFAGDTPTGTVSIGDVGNERTLTNVAAGRVTASSTDAINGSQLFASNQAIENLNTDLQGSKVRYYSVNDGGTQGGNYDNDGATGVNALAGGVGALASSDNGSAIGAGATVSDADSVALGSNSVANGASLGGTAYQPIDTNGNPIAVTAPTASSEVSVGDAGSERRITNVAAGSSDTDAVNVSQLSAVDQKANTASQGWDLSAQGDAATTTNVAPGDSVDLSNTDGNLTIAKTATDDNVTFDLADDVTIGNSLTVNNGPTINDDGIDMGGDAITNIGAPTNGGDAVNLDYFTSNKAHYYSINDGGTQDDNYANDGATGLNAIAAGVGASATADGATGLGFGADASILGSVALGSGSVSSRAIAPASGAIPAGSATVTYNTTDKELLGAVSVGDSDSYRQITNLADGTQDHDAVSLRQLQGAIGSVTNTGTKYFHANSAQPDSIAAGQDSIAVGPNTVVNGDDGVGMGNGAIVDQAAPGGTAIGDGAHVMLADGMALGASSLAEAEQGLALGAGATVSHDQSVALGSNSTTSAPVGTAGTTLDGTDYDFAGTAPQSSVSVGSVGNERTITNVAAGRVSEASTDAINGSQLNATNQALEKATSTANMGWDLSAQGADTTNVAPGDAVDLTNDDGNLTVTKNATDGAQETVTFALSDDVEIGNSLIVNNGPTITEGGIDMDGDTITNVGAPVNEGDAVNLEYLNQNSSHYYSVNDGGTQGGNYANNGASGVNAIAAGVGASATADEATALGAGATAEDADSVALGAGSVTAPVEATTEMVINGETYVVAGPDPAGSVSVGSEDNERTVINVAAGRVNETSTDAINGSQLYAANQSIESLGDEIEAGQMHYYSVNDDDIQGGNYSNDGAAGVNAIAAGVEASAKADGAIAMGTGATAGNADSVALGAGATTAAAVGTADIAIGGQTYDFAGTSPIGTLSIGATGAERTITNVAAGRISAASTDAINGSQLYATNQVVGGVDDRVTTVEGDVEKIDGRVTNVEGDVTQLDDRVTSVEGDVTNLGDNLQELDDRAVKYDTEGGNVDYDSITLEGDDGTTITNLADGEVSEDSSDAVNGGQLWEVQEKITNINDGGTKYFKANSGAAGAKAEGAESVAMGPKSVAQGDHSVAAGDGAVAESEGGVALGADSQATREGMDGAREAISGEQVASTQGAVSVGSEGSERQITHVAGGTQDTDAVNLRQLESVQAGSVNYDRSDNGSVDYSSVTLGKEGTPAQVHNVASGEVNTDAANVGQLKQLNQQFRQQIGGLHDRIDDVEDQANAGSASAIAAASVPQAYLPGKSMVSAGAGTYSGEAAVAVGVSRLSENGRWAVKFNATGDSQSNFGAGVGAGFHW